MYWRIVIKFSLLCRSLIQPHFVSGVSFVQRNTSLKRLITRGSGFFGKLFNIFSWPKNIATSTLIMTMTKERNGLVLQFERRQEPANDENLWLMLTNSYKICGNMFALACGCVARTWHIIRQAATKDGRASSSITLGCQPESRYHERIHDRLKNVSKSALLFHYELRCAQFRTDQTLVLSTLWIRRISKRY